jgi:hypothetical protein
MAATVEPAEFGEALDIIEQPTQAQCVVALRITTSGDHRPAIASPAA